MDNGIWATWYDLDDGERDSHVDWLHGKYLPELSAMPGIAWAAHYEIKGGGPAMKTLSSHMEHAVDPDLGTGTQFIVLVGAASPHVFFRPNSPIYEANQSAQTRERLAQRIGVRPCVFLEEARITGPDYDKCDPGGVTGPAIQMGSFRVRSLAEEFDLAAWYAQYRLPHMSAMSGSIRARKLMCVAGWAKHSVIYEFTSLDARLKNFEEPHESLGLDEKEWTGRVARMTVHVPGSPSVAERVWPPVK